MHQFCITVLKARSRPKGGLGGCGWWGGRAFEVTRRLVLMNMSPQRLEEIVPSEIIIFGNHYAFPINKESCGPSCHLIELMNGTRFALR